ncbi:class I SAM-dependent methyltransferase [Dactylosporangium sp. CS-033363]|uniref:class I SAM-dependent methyltransferase n=1 Tax=Dactylosporangium sp. CS-033363 TaxID=3239935 RepID=UPI003D93B7C2
MIAAQFANPRGLLGRLVGRVMARDNAQLTRRVVAVLGLSGGETVVEFGPGPGVGLRLLAEALPRGRVIGVEPSPVMRAQASRRTRRFPVELVDGTAATVALPAASADAICAVNNVQLWQPLPESLARVMALLRPGGVFAIGVTEHAVLPDDSSAGRHYDDRLLPHLREAGFTALTAAWEPGGNGHELLVTARRPG